VAAEMIAAQSGVGFLIFSSRLFAQTDYVFTGIISLGIMGSVADLLLRKIVGLVAYRYDIKL
jgi:NitT/TauT family transport system permease protein